MPTASCPPHARLIIRSAREEDSAAIAELINSLTHYLLADPPEPAAEVFLAGISQLAIAEYIRSPNYRYLLGFVGESLAGVAALRDNKHLFHLFVNPQFHRQGIAKALWTHLKEAAINAGSSGTFTVNSSIYAIPAYSQLGFTVAGAPQRKNGILFQPMQIAAGV